MKKGFTLIEILVTVIIIAILTAIAVVSYTSINRRSRDVKRKSALEKVRQALEMYRSDNGFYPAVDPSNFGTLSDLSSVLVPTYLPSIPLDPKSTQGYYYQATNGSNSNYYGYCVCALLENTADAGSTCTLSSLSSSTCNYGVRQP
jgi:general secretion pathway protein G